MSYTLAITLLNEGNETIVTDIAYPNLTAIDATLLKEAILLALIKFDKSRVGVKADLTH